jgi:DNA-directed RNA polymerase specialized sigma24 family protein
VIPPLARRRTVTEEEQLAAEFETHRPYLHAIAFRMLGSHADADDAAQEAWLRLARTGGGGIEDLRGWLTTVTGRICLDVLRRRGVRSEQPLELSVGMLRQEAGSDRPLVGRVTRERGPGLGAGPGHPEPRRERARISQPCRCRSCRRNLNGV